MKPNATVYDDIDYPEKWLFRLSAKQLTFLTPFILASYFVLVHIDASPPDRIILAIIPPAIGLYALHSQYDKKLGYVLAYFKRGKQLAFSIANSVFGIIDIRDDVLVFSNKLTAVLRVIPRDFYLKSDVDKETTIDATSELINSFTYPVRILMLTRKQNLSEYFANLKQNVDSNYADYISDIEQHFQNLIREREIHSRDFYLCIDYLPVTDYTSAVEELSKRVDACAKRLTQAGHTSERLTTGELMSLVSKLVIP